MRIRGLLGESGFSGTNLEAEFGNWALAALSGELIAEWYRSPWELTRVQLRY